MPKQVEVSIMDVFVRGMMEYGYACGHTQEEFDRYSNMALDLLRARWEAVLAEEPSTFNVVGAYDDNQ
jgi:hypothetical protein